MPFLHIMSRTSMELKHVKSIRPSRTILKNFQKVTFLNSIKKEKEEVVKNFDNLGKILYSPTNPKAFTEKGLYMLATILKSPKATETTLAIVEAYAKLKELSRVIVEIPQHEDKSTEQQVLLHRGGQLVEDIMSDILPKQSSETSFGLNLAMFKFKHSIKRESADDLKQLEAKLAELKKANEEMMEYINQLKSAKS